MGQSSVNSFLQPYYLKLSCSLAVFGVIVYIPILFNLSLNQPNHLLASFLNAAVNIPVQKLIAFEHIYFITGVIKDQNSGTKSISTALLFKKNHQSVKTYKSTILIFCPYLAVGKCLIFSKYILVVTCTSCNHHNRSNIRKRFLT